MSSNIISYLERDTLEDQRDSLLEMDKGNSKVFSSSSLVIEKLEIRNFMSFGNVPQTFYFDKPFISLILGENLDTPNGQSSGSRNGAGKTSIINALCYALFGQPLLNIRKDNLINNINQKNMETFVRFRKDGNVYEIHRGRKPNFLIYRVNNQNQTSFGNLDKDANGDNFQNETESTQESTQREIEKVLGFDILLFRHIFAMNTYTEPFLSMRASDQREFMETLFRISELSQKGEILKEKIRETKEKIIQEQANINAILQNNENIMKLIQDNLEKSKKWQEERKRKLDELSSQLEEYENIDVKQQENLLSEIDHIAKNIQTLQEEKNLLQKDYDHLNNETRLIRNQIELLKREEKNREKRREELSSMIEQTREYISQLDDDLKNIIIEKQKIKDEIENENRLLENSDDLVVCSYCGQKIDDPDKIMEKKEEIKKRIDDLEKKIKNLLQQENKTKNRVKEQENNLKKLLDEIEEYSDEKQILEDSSSRKELDIFFSQLEQKIKKSEEYASLLKSVTENIEEIEKVMKQKKRKLIFESKDKIVEFLKNKEMIISKISQIENSEDPYEKNAKDLQQHGIKEIDYENLNLLNSLLIHQEFLLKILTSKDSFIRKRIMDQNLNFLNSRLEYYLDHLGLGHKIKFQNDLSVDIQYFGRNLDFDNLSRGEKTRVILGLGWAFRDIFESLYHSVNLVFIDELLDHGLDQSGLESSIYILKRMSRDRGKSVFLISHRDELSPRVDETILIKKENGFSTVEYGESIQDQY